MHNKESVEVRNTFFGYWYGEIQLVDFATGFRSIIARTLQFNLTEIH